MKQKHQGEGAPKLGIALAGGGFMGAVYELGALAAIEEALPGIDLYRAKAYVGVSAGAFVAAGLANQIPVREMVRLFVSEGQRDGFDPSRMMRPNLRELMQRARRLPPLLASAAWHYATRPSSAAASFRRVGKALPAGFFDAAAGEQFLKKLFSGDGRTDDFRVLSTKLRVVATDLDSAQAVEFGAAGFDHVPISRAVLASASLPGVFPPVEIDGHHFVDGALRKTLHASVPLNEGAELLLCLNPIVPLDTTHSSGRKKHLVDAGLPGVMAQTLRSLIHSRISVGMQRYKTAYPNADILLFEPDHGDDALFFINILATSGRQHLCEHAYRATRTQLWTRRHELTPVLAKHGLRLDLAVLNDRTRCLVEPIIEQQSKVRNLRGATGKLGVALDGVSAVLRSKRA